MKTSRGSDAVPLANGSRRPLVVELAGPAGAGKSSLRRVLLERDPEMRWVPLVSRSRLAPVYARQAASLLPTYLRHHRGTPWFTRQQAKAMALLDGWSKELDRVPASDGRTLLLDQGPVFRLAVLSEFGPPLTESPAFQGLLQRWMELWGRRIDLVVWLSAPRDVLLNRVRTRPQDHAVKQWAADPALARIGRYQEAIDRTIERIAAAGPVTVLRFDSNERSPVSLADDVLATLERKQRRLG